MNLLNKSITLDGIHVHLQAGNVRANQEVSLHGPSFLHYH